LSEVHFNLTRNIFGRHESKALLLVDITTSLTKGMLVDFSSQASWKSNDLLTITQRSHVKAKSLGEFWSSRFTLPAESVSVLGHLTCPSEGLVKACFARERSNLNENRCECPLIRAISMLFRALIGANDDRCFSLTTEACN
jgi:hypothetical protein